ncbi:MAG: ATP-binding cassette domain-containing protein [Proteobacteria bacterium]|nr:ATP-binding cassette domain-containing protein [Pseudomonadota bacterium]
MNNSKTNNKNSNFIQFKKVSKSFESAAGRFDALKSIDLTIEKGEYLAVVGKSGSGKSTLLNMLTGIDHPSQGTVAINSTDVHTLNESQLAKWRGENIGIVFQFFQLIATLTILENLILAMDFVNVIPKKEREKRAELLLAQVDISQHADKLPSALSGGEQQRAAIARALANNPPIVVADEPTGNLDSKTTEAIQKLFTQLVASGKTVIVVTHEDVSDFDYDRVITLNDGFVVSDKKKNSKIAGVL